MNSPGCHHLRFRNNDAYDINVEDFIKCIERKFDIDFRSLPEWKDLIQRLHITPTTCRQKIQEANFRKFLIIDKIYVQWCRRPSPFTLTDNLVRTSRKWHGIKNYHRKKEISVQSELTLIQSISLCEEESNKSSETAHPNTEIVPSEDIVLEEKKKIDTETDIKISETPPQICLPISLCTNLHKHLSPLDSKDSSLSKVTVISYDTDEKPNSKEQEWLLLKQTLAVKCSPTQLTIESTSLDEQCIKFSLTNCISKYLHVRLKCLTDNTSFKKIRIFPVTPIRLYPGVAIMFKFVFKLSQNTEDFISSIYFKVGRNTLSRIPTEALCIPIASKFHISRLISVSELVSIPPVYIWQIKYGYPKAAVIVSINDNNKYDMYVTKKIVDFSKVHEENELSVKAIAPNTESIEDRLTDSEIVFETKLWTSSKDELKDDVETINSIDITFSVLDEIVERSLDTFLFAKTYLHMQPYTKRKIFVNFTKSEHIGKHQCYYDLEFYESGTEEFILKRTVKIFGEVLPNPIQIHPILLDMSHSLTTHGFCEDRFTITNVHKQYPATIKIKLTSKMRRIFRVTPMETVIPTTSSVNFEVIFCSTDFLSVKGSDDLVHFTIKIVINGHKSIYDGAPPLFYEIIAPCALEFKKIYNNKYFKELVEKSSDDTNESTSQ